jgi:hypothetical protein
MMERTMRVQGRYGLIVLVVGLCALGIALLLTNVYRSEPVTFPFNLRPGTTASPVFRVDTNGSYLVELEAERTLPFDQLNCLLGISPGSTEPCELASPVDISWHVTSRNEVVAKGSSRERASGAWGDRVSRTLGSFSGKKGDEYVLNVESMKDASALSAANPRIVVRMHPLQTKSYVVIGQSLLWFGVAATLGGLLWFAFWRNRSQQVRSSDS